MNVVLFDDQAADTLLPLTYTRPVAALRVGILTIAEKWSRTLKTDVSFQTRDYLQVKWPLIQAEDTLWINGSVCPKDTLIQAISGLDSGKGLKQGEVMVAFRGAELPTSAEGFESIDSDFTHITRPWDIFRQNGIEIESDFKLITSGRHSQPLSDTNTLIGSDIFIEEGATVEGAILNAKSGPIYIGKDAEVMEGSVIRGPFALCEHGAVKMAGKIYGPTTVGPHSKVGGEVNNSVIQGYSNKGHDGFLGNSVLGEWCNLGADTNNSNLKNNYSEVEVWCHQEKKYIKSGLQFCGLIMGDHSKSGINTMFNTGTVVGVSANMYGGDFHKKFVPSFMWGGPARKVEFRFEKACEVAERMMERRGIPFDETERSILKAVYDMTADQR